VDADHPGPDAREGVGVQHVRERLGDPADLERPRPPRPRDDVVDNEGHAFVAQDVAPLLRAGVVEARNVDRAGVGVHEEADGPHLRRPVWAEGGEPGEPLPAQVRQLGRGEDRG
jgi:hypothetical protein